MHRFAAEHEFSGAHVRCDFARIIQCHQHGAILEVHPFESLINHIAIDVSELCTNVIEQRAPIEAPGDFKVSRANAFAEFRDNLWMAARRSRLGVRRLRPQHLGKTDITRLHEGLQPGEPIAQDEGAAKCLVRQRVGEMLFGPVPSPIGNLQPIRPLPLRYRQVQGDPLSPMLRVPAFLISGFNWPPNAAPPAPSKAHIASACFSAFLCSRVLGGDFNVGAAFSFLCHRRSLYSIATKVNDVANFLNGFSDVLGDLVVGQAQDRVAAQGQFVVAMAIIHEGHAIAVTAVAVDLDDETALRPHEIHLRPRTAHGVDELVAAEQRRELEVGAKRLGQPLLGLAERVRRAKPRGEPGLVVRILATRQQSTLPICLSAPTSTRRAP